MSAAAATVIERVHRVGRRLGARGMEALDDLLAQSFALPLDDARYRDNALVPGELPYEESFSERAPDALRVDLEPFGPGLAARARLEETRGWLTDLGARLFPACAGACRDRVAAWQALGGAARFGAFAGAAFDRDGVVELKLYREVGDAAHLPPGARALLADAAAAVPGVVPLLHAVSVGRHGVAERLYLRCGDGLRLADLAGLDGAAPGVPALAMAAAALTGRMFLVPNTAILGLRRVAGGCEIKLELLPAALPPPAQTLAAAERLLIDARGALRRWCAAIGPLRGDHAIGAVSVRIAPGAPPALNLYARPLGRGEPLVLAAG